MAKYNLFYKLLLGTILFISSFTLSIYAQNEDCLACHSDDTMSLERNGKEISLFVHEENFGDSVHGEMECLDCHVDFDGEEIPHLEGEEIYKVDCSMCHDTEMFSESIHAQKGLDCSSCHGSHEIQQASALGKNKAEFCISCHNQSAIKGFTKSIHYKKLEAGENSPSCLDCHGGSTHEIPSAKLSEEELHELCATCHDQAVENFENSLHGEALANKKRLAPNCITCHNSHKILDSSNPQSNTYVMNVPGLCGNCHKDGTQVSTMTNISQRHILENYSESIHGEGLLKRGLIVTAVCTSCHFSHNILPHENPASSINRNNITSTCMQCHQQIEAVHQKVIRGELWEKQPHAIPVCIDCHQPHEVRRVFYDANFTNDYCMSCHKNENLTMTREGENISLYVDINEHNNSAHKDNSCVKCHTEVSTAKDPVCATGGKVDCSICHSEHVDDYNTSIHGVLRAKGDLNAPDCVDCHGKHGVLKKDDFDSPTFSQHIPFLCGECHNEQGQAKVASRTKDGAIVENYTMSIHGKGLLESGLMVTATCIDCHTSHHELPAHDPMSSVNHNNIPETCAKCHLGIMEKFEKSVHSPTFTKTDKELPGCSDCHKSHTIARTDGDNFRQEIMDQCGRCHEDVTETYFDTFHGKVSKLGSIQTAKCYDCHGSHNILPTYHPESTLSRENAVETCKTCHPQSNRKFVGYLTHATHHDRDKFPYLFYTFWGMTILLLTTFTFFGLHTLLWLPRALAEKKKNKNKSH